MTARCQVYKVNRRSQLEQKLVCLLSVFPAFCLSKFRLILSEVEVTEGVEV